MNKFKPELFNKDLINYNYRKYEKTDNSKLKLKQLFQAHDNIKYLTLAMVNELDLDSSNTYQEMENKIIEFVQGWVNLGKLDDEAIMGEIIGHNIHVAIDHINQLFIDTFKIHFYELDDFYTQDVNPFRVSKNNVMHSEMNMYDIRNMNVQSTQTRSNSYHCFLQRDNKPKFWNILSKGRHYERNNLDGYRNTGDKESLVYKKYDHSELTNYN